MQITPHFSWDEFACKDGTPVPVHLRQNAQELAEALETIREYIGKPLYLNSVYRSNAHNTRVGGAKLSQHRYCTAADIRTSEPNKVAELLEGLIRGGSIPQGGIGIYNSFVHYDIRGDKARW